ncbi:hypothetical protein NDU88_001649 [Pleurodeles waltl]|uniref:Uncharacterized protein n=1 Tax=Pleurodeles waltl TaxID=8319 RepID=A0AAV7WMX6_PLEWA|nr:hypothetical protein NDU88_001649 [Pleurodeles waltl]
MPGKLTWYGDPALTTATPLRCHKWELWRVQDARQPTIGRPGLLTDPGGQSRERRGAHVSALHFPTHGDASVLLRGILGLQGEVQPQRESYTGGDPPTRPPETMVPSHEAPRARLVG